MFTALEVSFSTWLAVCFALRIVLRHLIIVVVNAIQEARERERERVRERKRERLKGTGVWSRHPFKGIY
jgi:protein-S-isoprenylcysteine O-methyltransferase Ste14